MILRNVLLLDSSKDTARACDMVLSGSRIESLLPPCTGEGEVDLDGKGTLAVLPGFVNAHGHAAMTLLRGLGEEAPLMEWLQKRIWPVEARLGPEHVHWGTLQALVEMSSKLLPNVIAEFAEMPLNHLGFVLHYNTPLVFRS